MRKTMRLFAVLTAALLLLCAGCALAETESYEGGQRITLTGTVKVYSRVNQVGRKYKVAILTLDTPADFLSVDSASAGRTDFRGCRDIQFFLAGTDIPSSINKIRASVTGTLDGDAGTIYYERDYCLRDCTYVKLVSPKSVKLSKTKASVFMLDGIDLTATVSPSTASQQVAWSSSKPAVAAVDQTGHVSALTPGTATIYAVTPNGKKAYCKVTVKRLPIAELRLPNATVDVDKGDNFTLTPVYVPESANDLPVVWKTSNKKVATVKNGVVTGVSAGTAIITVCSKANPKICARCDVTVTDRTVYRALLIINGDYRGSNLDLETELDGVTMQSALRASGKNPTTMYYVPTYKKLVMSKNLTKSGMEKALKALTTWGIDDNDVTLVYYSGHGNGREQYVYDEKYASIVGTDLKPYTVPSVKKALDKVKGNVIVILDSCFSGKFAGKGEDDGRDARNYNRAVVASFAEDMSGKALTTAKYHVITACAGYEYSYLAEYGPYYDPISTATYFLGQGLGYCYTDRDNPAPPTVGWSPMPADQNGDGNVSMGELYAYAHPLVLNDSEGDMEMQCYPANDSLIVAEH